MNKICFAVCLIATAMAITACGPLKAMHATYADYRGDVEANYMVQDARNRILSYDWYYDQKGQIDAQIANIEALSPDSMERGSRAIHPVVRITG